MMQSFEQPTRPRARTWRRRREQLDDIQELLLRIDAALVVRDPGTARSVDAYDGLRKQIIAAAGERRRMLVLLSEFSEALRLGQGTGVLQSKTDEWMLQANLVRLSEVASEDAFEIVGATDGSVVVSVPAYVDGTTGIIIRLGVAERVAHPELAASPEGQSQTASEQLAKEQVAATLDPDANGEG